MYSLSRHVDAAEDIPALFSDRNLQGACTGAPDILVQVFWNGPGTAAVEAMGQALRQRFPQAVIVGASSGGNICEGSLAPKGAVVSVTCFAQARLQAFVYDIETGKEAEAGRSLSASLDHVRDLKAVLFLIPPRGADPLAFVRAAGDAHPSLTVFGGGAVQGEGEGLLFGGKILQGGIIAVAFGGADLHVEVTSLFDWKPLGPSVTLTEVDGRIVRRIDGRPAFEFYRENLGIEDGEDLFLLEFPLLLERVGGLRARNPLTVEGNGGIRIGSDAHSGEGARLGYLDVGSLGSNVRRIVRDLHDFHPEGIFLYSCICRLFTLQEETGMETHPFQCLAPSSGFYTLGEICRLDGVIELLNSSEVVVAMREGEVPEPPAFCEDAVSLPANPSRERHALMTSRLFRFIGALTETLGDEIVERKQAESQAKAMAAEKDILFRELQHRVKNSMAIISSIASLEAGRAAAPETREALRKLESRISALASLYDILYVTGFSTQIELSGYLGRVVSFAAQGMGADAKGISAVCRIESLRLEVKRAISLGLVVNELVTDSVKYAFPGRDRGRIEVSLRREDGGLVLIVEDDGVGLPAGFDAASSTGFGLILVRSLADQLDASFSFTSRKGAVFELRFPL